jgi:hypothetical protein
MNSNPQLDAACLLGQELHDGALLLLVVNIFTEKFERVNDPIDQPRPTCIQTAVALRKRLQAFPQKDDCLLTIELCYENPKFYRKATILTSSGVYHKTIAIYDRKVYYKLKLTFAIVKH